jgi:hypothetical protein
MNNDSILTSGKTMSSLYVLQESYSKLCLTLVKTQILPARQRNRFHFFLRSILRSFFLVSSLILKTFRFFLPTEKHGKSESNLLLFSVKRIVVVKEYLHFFYSDKRNEAKKNSRRIKITKLLSKKLKNINSLLRRSELKQNILFNAFSQKFSKRFL